MGSRKTTDPPSQKEVKQADTLRELTHALQEKLKENNDRFKDIPTPVNFAKLETDVKHHDRIIYGLLIVMLTACISAYLHFDSKITAVSAHITSEFKNLDNIHRQLEEKINLEAKAVNARIDNIIIKNNGSSIETPKHTPTDQ